MSNSDHNSTSSSRSDKSKAYARDLVSNFKIIRAESFDENDTLKKKDMISPLNKHNR